MQIVLNVRRRLLSKNFYTNYELMHLLQLNLRIGFIPNSILICFNNLKYAKTQFTTPEVQNYHFAPNGDMLSLTFKNYYEFLFM